MRAVFIGGRHDGRKINLEVSERLRLYSFPQYEGQEVISEERYYRFSERNREVYFAHLDELNFWKSVDDFSTAIN